MLHGHPRRYSTLQHTGYDITNYFRSEVIATKTVENAASDGFRCNFSRIIARITEFYTVVRDIWPHKSAGYDVISYFQSAFIEVRKRPKMPPPTALGQI